MLEIGELKMKCDNCKHELFAWDLPGIILTVITIPIVRLFRMDYIIKEFCRKCRGRQWNVLNVKVKE